MKLQVSFFVKTLFIVISALAFVLIFIIFSAFQKQVAKEREDSNFKIGVLNIAQKLINDKENLAANNETKGVIDVSKIEKFASLYREIEPIPAEDFDFDYRVKIVQFSKKITTYQIPYKKIVYTNSYSSSIEEKTWSFGFPENSFSPLKARENELQISIPVIIKYNETFATEGILYIFAVKGELEKLHGLISYLCRSAEHSPQKDIHFSKEFSFSFGVSKRNDKICMLDACKKIICSFPIEFKNFEKGEHVVNFVYDSSSKNIYVR
jgi:hypothetical protein